MSEHAFDQLLVQRPGRSRLQRTVDAHAQNVVAIVVEPRTGDE
jgi:hypothetical protein